MHDMHCERSSGSYTAMSPGKFAAGYTSANSGATCTACIAGIYKASTGHVACAACGTGYTTTGGLTTGATALSQCDTSAVGYGGTTVSGGNSGYTICAAGYYKATGSKVICSARRGT